jgi:hypothetical protein
VLLSAIPTETLLGARAVLVKYSEDQPRDADGRFGEGSGSPVLTGALGKAADYWIEGSVDVRHALAAGHVIAGESPKSISAGRALAAAVVETGGPAPELYRGICRSGDDPHELDSLTNLKPGATFNGNLASWSSDQNIAKDFGGLFGDPRFLLKLEGGAQGLDLGDHSVMSQKEWITDGRFEVVSVDRNVKGGVQSRWGDTRTPLRATVITLRQTAVFDAPAQFVGSKAAKRRLPWPDEFDSALEIAFDQRMASPDARTDALHEQRATKAASTRTLRSGGQRRADSLDPIVSRLKDRLQALIDQHMPSQKGGPLTLSDQAQKLLYQAYLEAMKAGFDDTGADESGWDPEAVDQAAQSHAGIIGAAIAALGAALLSGSLSEAMADARMGGIASGLISGYESGFNSGVTSQGEVQTSTWRIGADDPCDLCDERDGTVWQGDPPFYPGDGWFGDEATVCRGSVHCRCSVDYDIVLASEADTSDTEDIAAIATADLSRLSVAELLRLRARVLKER